MIEILKGFAMGFGVISGMVISFFMMVIILKKIKGSNTKYKTDELLEAFEDYLMEIEEKEKYEEISIVELIISHLKKGEVIEEVYSYRIKKDVELVTEEFDSSGTVRINTYYTISGPKNQ
ncbi:hypothetical protein [Aegicerativicinus sediminis]|uniref:hypothetical protein n=1 Tax=Aegicerativicinus sediminis TaxID=2893202 RepID=UPI001E3182FE|nr:hypothetical protein [Aegicerativicinus sediminis]